MTGRRAERNVLPDTASGRSAAERTFGGLSDEQMRVRPREDLNSLAWLLWHIARVEDSMVNRVLAGRSQVFDDGWMKRLGISRRDFGTGMTSAEVTELTRQIDLGALREYRDAVGRRTREVVGDFKAQDWEGAFGVRTEGLSRAFTGRPRTMVLSGVALLHSSGLRTEPFPIPSGAPRAATWWGR